MSYDRFCFRWHLQARGVSAIASGPPGGILLVQSQISSGPASGSSKLLGGLLAVAEHPADKELQARREACNLTRGRQAMPATSIPSSQLASTSVMP